MMTTIILDVAIGLLCFAMTVAAVRAFIGPRTTNRALASDLIFFGVIGLVTLIALRIEADALFDIILIATLLGFTAPLSMARLASGGQR